MRQLFGLLVVILSFGVVTQAQGQSAASDDAALTVQKIMQDPKTWIGAWPRNAFWTEDGSKLYFNWNPQGAFPSDSLFSVSPTDTQPRQVSFEERYNLSPRFSGWQHGKHIYDAAFNRKVYSKNGDVFLYDRTSNEATRLTRTRDSESSPRFSAQKNAVIFEQEDNLFHIDLNTGMIGQLTDLRSGQESKETAPTPKAAFLEEQQLALFEHVRDDEEQKELREKASARNQRFENPPPTFYAGRKSVRNLSLDPTERFVSFILSSSAPNRTSTVVQDYVTSSGYATDLTARPKVGGIPGTTELYIQDLERDTTYKIDLHQLDGSYDVPAYKLEEDKSDIKADSLANRRALIPAYVDWNAKEATAVVHVRAQDNKDRWIALLDPENGALKLLDRQHDEAWIAGPGISRFRFGVSEGWLPDNQHYYFQSEESGYSHLYLVDTATGDKKTLTAGQFEVFNPMLSRDGSTWYFTSSEGSPFERHFYKMALMGGTRTRLTDMAGNNQVALAPDEETMGNLYSYSNVPPEIYLKSSTEKAQQITFSTTDAWQDYAWRDPEIIHFKASDGVSVPARMYAPENPNGAAVLFVHGAGYLQNVHKWWSSYFREYMFHNLLADQGYTVLDVDYRASAGYGRDWRTAIYRYMGGRDLQDYVDASKHLQSTKNIDPERIFIYGGSYGGFITLMALFNEPAHFGGGAALRSVTDWAHYNHGYTSNILNTPAEDSLAYTRSSPIYFAEGLEDPLLIAHGMVDTNVHFQDVVRLAQRLIKLGKEDWEMALYPVESHGFQEPASWTDEYRRILKLIEQSVGPDREE